VRSGGKPLYILHPDTRCGRSVAKQQGIGSRESTVLANEVTVSRPPLIKIGNQTGTWWQEDTETVWRTWTNFTDFLTACYSMRNRHPAWTTFVGTLSPDGQPVPHTFTFTPYSPWRKYRKANFPLQTRFLVSFNWRINSISSLSYG
jgi:hypothetical protein